ncbi:putative 1-phosphatidylinositol-3-phosphate 5-kinase FAB1D isoform X1 [Salvia hispanica]|uniref:putative 1-phosphatidylinositol-3-phosphate 5-kinase FAB1D isoform X1 n=1 Tax=Salvia hispanica TaxID=49212 RepID=UPI002009DB5D|nr:putative 1-phosphatidylinositol-3-phosphate 5-kinase FAB1D isoform X1 [Salvia hispanica]XP_047977655.1 putative 1-phosphatidylinositol-3-phosphate 5-kinase FAB1D isoform X1 [Salvia hispanica]XP_047977656.1 putative 1-phosphatidylinositol-3-phosphate 5-kinase FAB1D isoform X1 [Salvia hispanica]
MCHYCGEKLAKSSDCAEQGNEYSPEPDSGPSIQSCKLCGKKIYKESPNRENSSSCAMPSISVTASLKSIESTTSNCSDISVVANSCERGCIEDSGTDSSQEDFSSSSKGSMDDSVSAINLNGFRQDDDAVKPYSKQGSHVDSLRPSENKGDTETAEVKAVLDNKVERSKSSVDESSEVSSLNDEINAEFWLPPEPDDQEDDVFGSVSNYDDDDDECGYGAAWAKPSSLSSFEEEGSGSHRFKEEKLKAMHDVKHGKFRSLISQLLKSVGVYSSGNSVEDWVDIVTSLSWEAASYVRPDAHEGKAMDPDGYVKIKCIATGSRTQSQLIKGLVFKKHAAHKHMPTKYKIPRLLLIHGALELSAGGLSSFESMQQENDNLKTIIDMIDMYHPNVVLVEKSVSRDIQESILAKGITLVFDMKFHRLERVARCIGSPILASEVGIGQKLRQCDSFRIEKFVEEYAAPKEGGKKQSKTLMFLEGAPTRLACTILLMGANSDELKRIKCVVRCAVVMAYHLMLETSFLLDQTAMFSTISPNEMIDLALTDIKSTLVGTNESTAFADMPCDTELNKPLALDFRLSDQDKPQILILSPEGDSSVSLEACNPETFPGLSISTSIQRVMDDSFPLFSNSPQKKLSLLDSDLTNKDGPDEKYNVQISSLQEEAEYCYDKPKARREGENLLNNEQSHQLGSSDTLENCDLKDEINSVLDSESILVLMSSCNASLGSICEHRRFSHIKFYRSFDVPLGKFLQDKMLNQRLQCKVCDEPPEAHFFYYAHHNKQLTIQVRRLPARKILPGETEGKLWMWSRCGRCKLSDGIPKSTKRVLLSTAACGLSFGKFLELSFSNHSSFSSPSCCGHSYNKDFIYFFGLGPMVAMFKYSLVSTYSVSLPPQMMQFNYSGGGEFLKKDSENVHSKGISMFLEIEKCLMDLRNRYVGVTLKIQGSDMEFSDIVEMLREERSQFEVEVQNATNGSEDGAVCKILSLNRVRLDLMLESCIWDRRLHALLSSEFKVIGSDLVKEDGIFGQPLSEADTGVEEISVSEFKQDFDGSDDYPIKEIPIDGDVEGSNEDKSTLTVAENIGRLNENGAGAHDFLVKPTSEDHFDSLEGNSKQENLDSGMELQTGRIISISSDIEGVGSDSNNSLRFKHYLSMFSNLENGKGWVWAPFTDIRREYLEDLQRGYLPKFESCSSYAVESTAQKLISDEGSRLHIPLGMDDYIVSDYEDEFSSIIACALTLLKDDAVATEDLAADVQRERGIDTKLFEGSQSLPRIFSLTAPNWSSFGSFDLDSMHSPSASMGDLHSSSFDGLNLLESLVSYGASHPEVSMGLGKYPGKRKYSVVCVYASQFRQLRDRCCPSEVSYIASLSRCRYWNAKGGKSKSFFAKTLDDRFILKEIKRTEFESFMKFAPNYFDYMNECYEKGNQTCLAKILGIYQVVIRATKHGKETRHDLIVMENLSFGRQISKQYDLKGALHARLTAGNDAEDVLLDQNFVNDMNISPLYVSRRSKRNLQRAVYNDTNFLNSINVMDYSLLVGVDTQRRELVGGIIDYLRQYTWDKYLESWVKSSLVVPKNVQPTIVSPREYKKRFRKFIDTHFLSVPDHWCSRRSSNPCQLCGPSLGTGLFKARSFKKGSEDEDSSNGASCEQGTHGAGSLKSPAHDEQDGPFS